MRWPWTQPDRTPEVLKALEEVQAEVRKVGKQSLRTEARWDAMHGQMDELKRGVQEGFARQLSTLQELLVPADTGTDRFALALITVADSVEQAQAVMVQAANGAPAEEVAEERRAFAEMLIRILAQVRRTLSDVGIDPLPGEGSLFDPRAHRAIGRTVAPGMAGRVVGVARRGYRMDGRILRVADVLVGAEENEGGSAE